MTEQVAIKRLVDHFEVHDDGRPHPFLDEAVSMAINALEKQIAKKPVGLQKNVCPSCSWIVTYKCDSYCPICGQRILCEDSEV